MGIFKEEHKKQLKEVLLQMKNTVNLIYFTQEYECGICEETRTFLEEFVSLSDKIKLEVKDFEKEKNIAEKYKVDKIPAIVMTDKDNNDFGIKYYGPPAGYEINSFLVTLLEVSGVVDEFSSEIAARIDRISKPVHIQVFVSLQCPYCPKAVIIAHKLALMNKNITADMVEGSVFPYLTTKYNVSGVPKTIINENKVIAGAHPIEKILEVIESL